MAVVDVICSRCSSKKVIKHGISKSGEQRYRCQNEDCGKTFQLNYQYNACTPGFKERIVDMALNGSGIRDTSRVLSISIGTIITTLKKSL